MTYRSLVVKVIAGGCAAWLASMPAPARACSPGETICVGDLALASTGPLPVGGVLVFDVKVEGTGYLGGEEGGPWLEVSVKDSGGTPVSGEVTVSSRSVAVWRPGEPLVADETYEVTASWGGVACAGTVSGTWMVTSSAAPMPALVVPAVTAETTVDLSRSTALDSLICCDDAYPKETASNGCGISVDWSEGTCAPSKGTNFLEATLTLDPAVTGADFGQVEYLFAGAGGMYPFDPASGTYFDRSTQAVCGSVAAHNLATDEWMMGPMVCHGEALADMLGDVELDVAEELAACEGPAYTCAVEGEDLRAWDSKNCEKVEGVGGEGCLCVADADGSPWGLAALLLPWALRRRKGARDMSLRT